MKKLLFVIAMSALAGCTWTRPHQIAASTTPLPNANYTVLAPAAGSSCETHLLGFLRLGTAATLQDAIDEALQESKGEALVDVTSDFSHTNLLVFTTSCVKVKGKAIKK